MGYKNLADKKAWRDRNKEKVAAVARRYYEKHREKILAKAREKGAARPRKLIVRLVADPVRLRAAKAARERRRLAAMTPEQRAFHMQAQREWEGANREKRREARRRSYVVHREATLQRTKQWRAKNPDKVRLIKRVQKATRRARQSGNGGSVGRGIIQRLHLLQRDRCALCKKKLSGVFHLDHIMPLALGGQHSDENLQLLCPPCNIRKGAQHPVEFAQAMGMLL